MMGIVVCRREIIFVNEIFVWFVCIEYLILKWLYIMSK